MANLEGKWPTTDIVPSTTMPPTLALAWRPISRLSIMHSISAMDMMVNYLGGACQGNPNLPDLRPIPTLPDFHPFCSGLSKTTKTKTKSNNYHSNVVCTFYTWIKDFVTTAGVFAVGEVLDDRYHYTGGYTKVMDAVFNYPKWFNLIKAFLNPQADRGLLATSVNLTKQTFKNRAMSTVSFTENHDNARNPSGIFDPMPTKSIITWTFGGDGIPSLYYGQEASCSGGIDPTNREALWFTSYSTDVTYYKFITKLNQARKLALATTYLNSTSVWGTKAQAGNGNNSSTQDSGAFHSQAATSSVIVSVLACALAFLALA
ncbi:hypothetical protein FRC01_010741 [Tulasnella sp. 417]|nr:hypothetical protein FRC01_010741 [Tulasnella sp. 417]